jgi:hypothetical protein
MLLENEVPLQVGDITLEPGVNMYGITGDDAMDCGTLGANCASGDKYLGHSRNVSHPASHPSGSHPTPPIPHRGQFVIPLIAVQAIGPASQYPGPYGHYFTSVE